MNLQGTSEGPSGRAGGRKPHGSNRMVVIALGVICFATGVLLIEGGCITTTGGFGAARKGDIYPPTPQKPRAVALGNLRSGPPPSATEVQVAVFLFGEEPDAPLAFMRPLSVGLAPSGVLVCDAALGLVLKWDNEERELAPMACAEPPSQPVATTLGPGGDVLIADAKAGAVIRVESGGRVVRRYMLPPGTFRPAGLICVGEEIWVTNAAAHRIEVFNATSGSHVRSIGQRGRRSGEFGSPLGMATTPDGEVCVVDMLNCRVQVFDASGKHVRNIGGPGDLIGTFGRPKDVAVGPDGTVFVTDAASQRVHVFDDRGRPLMAFGEPSEGIGALSVPGGVCISQTCPVEAGPMPGGFQPAYYVLVAEQLLRPGVRVYAWGQGAGDSVEASTEGRSGLGGISQASVVNPHWSASRCSTCHVMQGGSAVRLIAESVEQGCLSCHDGKKARMEAHPVGRLAVAKDIEVPADWPLADGRLGCLTCHDIRRHCDAPTKRPSMNAGMLRAFEPEVPLHFCRQCHKSNESWRMSPHESVDSSGRMVASTCRFCHSQTPQVAMARAGKPMLYTEGSKLCLTCHTRHWDVSPRGHVDRPVTPEIRRTMIAGELAGDQTDGAAPVILSAELDREPALLPLSHGNVTCYTCHNPHAPGLFPKGSPQAATSDLADDEHYGLRVSSMELCLSCHAK